MQRVLSIGFVFAIFGLTAGLLAASRGFCLTSQDVPGADLPTASASPGMALTPAASPAASPAAQASPTVNDINQGPSPAADDNSTGENEIGNDADSTDLGSAGAEASESPSSSESPTPSAENEPAPALDAGAMTVGPDLGSQSLDAEINKAVAPPLAASLRLTEGARKSLADGQIDDASRDLSRAISLDPSNAFAYYYLGRANLARKNYSQALTFFRRAEIGFNGRSDWTAEALSYEGLCDEELSKPLDAAQAYKRALAASPDNFKARIGYGRLASLAAPPQNVDAPAPEGADNSPPEQDLANPPPNASDESAPPEPSPEPPPE